MAGNDNFLFLNRDNRWADFVMRGLELGADGAVRLVSRPLLRGRPGEPGTLPEPDGPCGIAVAADGSVYFADPAGDRVMKIEACDETRTPAPVIRRAGTRPGELMQPRGVAFHAQRGRLVIADTGNHRIQVFDARSLQFMAAWTGERGPLRQPWSLACDPEGSVYVVEHGARRIQKFDASGVIIGAFWRTLSAEVFLSEPTEVAVGMAGGAIEIFILDTRARKIVVVDADGRPRRAFSLRVEPIDGEESDLPAPMGLAVAVDAVYVGDNGQRRVFTYAPDGAFAGPALGFDGPVAGMAVAPQNVLLVHQGSDAAPVCLDRRGACGRFGFMWGGPFENTSTHVEQLHQLALTLAPMASGAHLRLHLSSASGGAAPPVDVSAAHPFGAPAWAAQPPGVTACVIPGAPLDRVWVGIEFGSDGLATPELRQARLEFDHQGYVPYLPAIYREDAASRQFLNRFLSIFEGPFDEVEEKIARLPALFDPDATGAEFLSWLAGWLALDLDDNWPESQQRQAIATAFALYARRGTPEGLRAALAFFAGIDARIDEPIRHAAWWALPPDEAAGDAAAATSMLGYTTMLAAAEPLGAVVGATAILDESHLITQEEFGRPLFDDVAHTFTVQIYRGCGYSQRKRDEVRDVIEREKPAHTTYHLCVVEPRMRLGFQARLGIDTVVAGVSGPIPLGQEDPFVSGLVLGGAQGSIGPAGRVGRTVTLGD